jgi:hypothetical protein
MTALLTEEMVQESIRAYLLKEGWNYNFIGKKLHEQGVDIVVRDGNNKHKARYLFIECKGKSTAISARSIAETNFLFALGQLITRMRVIAKNAYLYGLGLPEESAMKALRRIPWQVAKHLSLRLFSVSDEGVVIAYTPKDFKRHQSK